MLVDKPSAFYLLDMKSDGFDDSSLDGMLLVATPGMSDPRFAKAVIYLCTYSKEGAMGLIVNQLAKEVEFDGIIGQLGIEVSEQAKSVPVHVGGPVETSRGFVLHSNDYSHPDTLVIDGQFALSATIDILKAIASGTGPSQKVFALGYAGWAPGQLDQEIQASGWLLAPSDSDIVFGDDHTVKWTKALQKLGVDPNLLSGDVGHA